MKYTKNPNLPLGSVEAVVVSNRISQESIDTLSKYNISVITTKDVCSVDNNIAHHADIAITHIGDNNFVCEESVLKYYKKHLSNANICSGDKLSKKYPGDISYNSAIFGKYIICKKESTDKKILEYAEKEGLILIDTKQGYSKCNVCIINEKACITSDKDIYNKCRLYGIDVLFTDDSRIGIDGYNQGFLGGASGKISHDKLAVNGNINTHTNATEIISFARKYGVEVISLNNSNILDIGSILPVFEK